MRGHVNQTTSKLHSEQELNSLRLPSRNLEFVEVEVKYVVPIHTAQRIISEFDLSATRIHQSYLPESKIEFCLRKLQPLFSSLIMPFDDVRNDVTQVRLRRIEHSDGTEDFNFALKGKRGAGRLGVLSRFEVEVPISGSQYTTLRSHAIEGYLLKDRFVLPDSVNRSTKLFINKNNKFRAPLPFKVEIDLIRETGLGLIQDLKKVSSKMREQIALVDCEVESSLARQFQDRQILKAFYQGKHNLQWLKNEGWLVTGNKQLHHVVRAPRMARKDLRQISASINDFAQLGQIA